MPAMQQSAPPTASRRVVSTIPIPSTPKSDFPKLPRKFSLHHHRPSPLRSPPVIALISVAILVLLYLASLLPLRCSNQPLPLIPDLERWADPNFARQRLRIYVYSLPTHFNTDLVDTSIRNPGPIRDPRCDKNFYSAEVHVHRFLLNSPVRTKNPEEAHFFYVPIYTTCDLITHQPNDLNRVGANFQSAMNIVINDYPYWNRTNGRNHVHLFSQGFSARLAGDWVQYKNSIFMVHNGEFTAPEYTPHKDITIPPELRAYLEPYWHQHPSATNIYDKKYLAQFGGQVVSANVTDHRGSNYSGGVRQFIQAHLTNNPDYRITGVRSDSYLSDMKRSKFCLAPEGWHPWSPRPYYSVLMGCIPVIISEVQELAFEELVDWDSFAVWIRPRDITNLDTILRSFSDAEIERRRAAMKKVWRTLWYAKDGLAYQAILRSLYIRKYKSIPRRHFSGIR